MVESFRPKLWVGAFSNFGVELLMELNELSFGALDERGIEAEREAMFEIVCTERLAFWIFSVRSDFAWSDGKLDTFWAENLPDIVHQLGKNAFLSISIVTQIKTEAQSDLI